MGGVDDVDLAPLEEEAGERYALAGHDVAGLERGVHAVSADGDEEVGTGEDGYVVVLALVGEDGYVAGECSCHGVDGEEWNALAWRGGRCCDGDT